MSIKQIQMEERILSESVAWAENKINHIIEKIDIEENKIPPDEEVLDKLQSELKFWYNRIKLEERNANRFEEKYGEFILSGALSGDTY